MRKNLLIALVLMVVVAAAFVSIRWYSYVFARTVQGEITGIERVTDASLVIGVGRGNSPVPANQLYSFAVAIRDPRTSQILTASSEDRQWAVATPGLCATAKFFPYPFWDFEKSGTYFGARLLSLYDCPGKTPGAAPALAPTMSADPVTGAPIQVGASPRPSSSESASPSAQ